MVHLHMMNDARRAAFRAMVIKNANTGRAHSFFWEHEVMNRGLAVMLEDLGWLDRFPGRHGLPTTIRLTAIGIWILGGARA